MTNAQRAELEIADVFHRPPVSSVVIPISETIFILIPLAPPFDISDHTLDGADEGVRPVFLLFTVEMRKRLQIFHQRCAVIHLLHREPCDEASAVVELAHAVTCRCCEVKAGGLVDDLCVSVRVPVFVAPSRAVQQ